MRIGLQEPDWEYIGACLAATDDNNQTAFFKSFAKECKSWGTSYQIEMQLIGVSRKLSNKEKEILSTISYIGDE